MSRDRLAELRGDSNKLNTRPTDIEMGQIGVPNMDSFFQEVEYLQSEIQKIYERVRSIEDFHGRSLNILDEQQASRNNQQLDRVVEETKTIINGVKTRIKAIDLMNQKLPAASGDTQIRRTQHSALTKKFIDAVGHFQNVEREYRQKYRQKMEKQYRIANPQATEQEIQNAVNDESAGQVFAQQVMQTSRTGEAKKVLREVQERHEDIKKIEKTILELNALFQEMSLLVNNQQTIIDNIEQHVEGIVDHVDEAGKQLDTAIQHRRSSRAKLWCICFCVVLIIIAIVLIIYFLVVRPRP